MSDHGAHAVTVEETVRHCLNGLGYQGHPTTRDNFIPSLYDKMTKTYNTGKILRFCPIAYLLRSETFSLEAEANCLHGQVLSPPLFDPLRKQSCDPSSN